MADDTVSDTQRRAEAMELNRIQLQRLLSKDMMAWADAFADEAVVDFPFAPPNYPKQIRGKEAIREYVKDYAVHIDLHEFPEFTVHETLDPAVLVVEARVVGQMVATGAPYEVGYVWVIRTEKGKIVHQRDYWNPLAVLDAVGGGEALRDAFNVAGH